MLLATASKHRILLLALIAPAAAACGPGKSEDKRSVADAATAAVTVDAAVVSDLDGSILSLVQATSPNTQIVKASASSRIVGSRLAFPPGAFDIDSNITLEEGRNVATQANIAKLIDASTIVQAAAPAVVVTFAYDQDTFQAYTTTIPVPSMAGLTGSPDQNLVVLYVKNLAESDDYSLGFIAAKDLQVADAFVSFDQRSYGVFQAVYLNKAATAAKQVKTQDKVQKLGKVQGPPEGFNITGPVGDLIGGRPRITWEPANGADSYELKLDATDAACGAPYKVYDKLTTTNQMPDKIQDGVTYVCIAAKNTKGATKAVNSGFKFKADASPPPVPAQPTSSAGAVTSDISFTFQWNAVEDVGPAGLANYILQVGTTANASDIFNGPVTTTQKEIIGFDGQTYYARVKAIDTVGNESAWSPLSAGVRIDSSH